MDNKQTERMTEQEMLNAGCPPALARKLANQCSHEFRPSVLFGGITMCLYCGVVLMDDAEVRLAFHEAIIKAERPIASAEQSHGTG